MKTQLFQRGREDINKFSFVKTNKQTNTQKNPNLKNFC